MLLCLLNGCLESLVIPFGVTFPMFAVVAKAEGATFPPGSSFTVSAFTSWGDVNTHLRVWHNLHSLKTEYRAKERCRNLMFSQTTWITICWKVIIEFSTSDTKNKLPTSALTCTTEINEPSSMFAHMQPREAPACCANPMVCSKNVNDILHYTIQWMVENMCPWLTGLKTCLCAPSENLDSLS